MDGPDGNIELVIFDCDGVLVDSEPLAIRVLRQTIKEFGVQVSEEEAYTKFLGRSLGTVSNILSDEYGISLDVDALARMRERLYALFRTELHPTKNVLAALKSLGVPLCVASSSQPERISLSMEITGLGQYFGENIFSATMVENGKPAPDLFLYAAAQMGVQADKCLVIEDSPTGIQAGQAAGMQVFAYTGGTHMARPDLQENVRAQNPAAIFGDMDDLPEMVNNIVEPVQIGAAENVVVAVDVGTKSVRAGIVTLKGKLLSRSEENLQLQSVATGGEYTSDQIWRASCQAVKQALQKASIDKNRVAAIGFDATCSLVILDKNGAGLPVSDGDMAARSDTIAWFDHRAKKEAAEVSSSGHALLKYSGMSISPEMELPKLIWLKRNMPDTWNRMGYAFDLADFLTWKSTGSTARSMSTLTSKWTYMGHENSGWTPEFFEAFGVADIFSRGQLPDHAAKVGTKIGQLSPDAADQLGLTTNCAVAAGMIDAHAGALGVLGQFLDQPEEMHKHLGLIAGTSSCVMALSTDFRPITGIWGPYFGAVQSDLWLNEGGQSATGALLDHVVQLHSAGGEPTPEKHGEICERIRQLREQHGAQFAARLHVLPDFNGNRSPHANPDALGVVSGLSLDVSFDALCALYWRTCVAIAMSLRQILEIFEQANYETGILHVTGGHTQNPVLMELYRDVTGCTLVTRDQDDAVLIGNAIAGATAAGLYPDQAIAAQNMCAIGLTNVPAANMRARYDADYEIYKQMHVDRLRLEEIADGKSTI